MSIQQNLSLEQLSQYKKNYEANPVNRAVESAVYSVGLKQAALDPEVVKKHTFVFSDETKQGAITAQKHSGRCWYFAALNSLRQKVMEKLNVESFEFSQTHLYFYDKMEKANTYLEQMIRLAERPLDDRELSLLIQYPVYDGGYWDGFKNLCLKYGLVPKQVGPESFHSGDSDEFVNQMDIRLAKAAMDIRKAHQKDASEPDLREIKDRVLSDIYNIAVKCLGHPVEAFSFTYYDKDKKFHRLDNQTPQSFFEEMVGREAVENRISLISDPRDIYPFGRRLGQTAYRTVFEKEPIWGLNVPMEDMAQMVIASLKAGDPVWFACDVGKSSHRDKGILDSALYAYDRVLPALGEFSKKDRFESCYSELSHAMNLTGVDLDAQGNPINWKVENSWGEKVGEKGLFSMSHQWFMDFVFEATVDLKYVPEKWRAGLDQDVIVIPPWDHYASILRG